MILGTVQLGMDYGIHNTTGKPSTETSFQILDYAWQHGIRMLDTAGAYGNAEDLIGEYQQTTRHEFYVCTKTVSETADGLTEDLEKSLFRLACKQLHVYYLHRYEACKQDTIMRILTQAKEQGKIANIGLSLYEPSELEYILETFPDLIDVVQIPFNLLDHSRWQKHDLLKRANEKGIRIFARSIFLQGLFFQDPDSEPAKALFASEALRHLRKIADMCSMSMQQLAVTFVQNQPDISDLLLGCETLEQLKQNISLSGEGTGEYISAQILRQINILSENVNELIIDPRKWNGRH